MYYSFVEDIFSYSTDLLHAERACSKGASLLKWFYLVSISWYSRCGQKSYSVIFFSFKPVKSFQDKRFIQTPCFTSLSRNSYIYTRLVYIQGSKIFFGIIFNYVVDFVNFTFYVQNCGHGPWIEHLTHSII